VPPTGSRVDGSGNGAVHRRCLTRTSVHFLKVSASTRVSVKTIYIQNQNRGPQSGRAALATASGRLDATCRRLRTAWEPVLHLPGKMGRPRLSAHTKRLRGTLRPSRERAYSKAAPAEMPAEKRSPVPQPPRQLSKPERAAWVELAAELDAQGGIAASQLSTFKNCCLATVHLNSPKLPPASYSPLLAQVQRLMAELSARPAASSTFTATPPSSELRRQGGAELTEDGDEPCDESCDASCRGWHWWRPLPPLSDPHWYRDEKTGYLELRPKGTAEKN
jgi:hypothetical protein